MITYAETLEVIERIVAEKGADYVYTNDPVTIETASIRGDVVDQTGDENFPACYYRQYDGTPGCIVGQFLAVHKPDFSVTEGQRALYVIEEAQIPVSLKALHFLGRLQAEQDRGAPWGLALEQAKASSEGFAE